MVPFLTARRERAANAGLVGCLFRDGERGVGLVEQAREGRALSSIKVGNLPRELPGAPSRSRPRSRPATVALSRGTRRDLDRDVASGPDAGDLFFLLAGGRVELPPLRERDGDVALLATHFWNVHSRRAAATSRRAPCRRTFCPASSTIPGRATSRGAEGGGGRAQDARRATWPERTDRKRQGQRTRFPPARSSRTTCPFPSATRAS